MAHINVVLGSSVLFHDAELCTVCSSGHNYQRITRILDSVAALGAGYLQVPLISALINEVFFHRTLPNAAVSCRNYWIPTILDGKERQKLFDTANALQKKYPAVNQY